MSYPNSLKIASGFFASLFLLSALDGLSQTTVSTPIVGFNTLNVRAKSGSANANSFVSINLSRPKAFTGIVGTKSLNGSGQTVLTFSGDLFTSNQFNGTTNRHYFQIKSGSNDGLNSEVVATTPNTLTLSDNLDAVLENNLTSFDVIPYWTLTTAFPSGAGLKSGTSATVADTLTLIEFPSGNASTFFYSSSMNQWRRGTTDSSHVVIPPGSGIAITRKDPTAVGIKIVGQVPTGPTQADVVGGTSTAAKVSYIANPYPITSRTLATSGLYTGNTNTGVVGGSSSTVADTVTIFDPSTGTANSYFYNTSANQWRRGTSDSSSVTIPEGSAIAITRKANRGAFEWYIPQPNY